jgi:aldehyde:ferredoxin oxidoreductase
MTTFAGRLLRIDLSRRTHRIEEVADAHYRQFISARGLGVKLLYDELKPKVDPLGPENKLIFGIGVLGGTGLQGFSKWAVISKSPLSGTIFRSITGGNFGVWMKQAGYDLMVIEGKAERPSYVHIDAEGVHFLSADGLSGQDYRSVQRRLKERHGLHTEAACIGTAGERLVRYAVIHSGERTASRGGMGTVMGSKNLKAVSISARVRKAVPFDEAAFGNLVRQQIATLREHPRRRNMTTFGTPYITEIVDKLGVLPVKNFRGGSIQDVERISGDAFYELKKAKAGCHVCMTRCGGMRAVTRGPFQGTEIDGPEYETIFAFGPVLGLSDKDFVINANALCDYYGIDTISTGVSIAFLFELFERGIVSPSDTDGLILEWGNTEAVFSLIEKIGKREGIGYLLGEGVKRAGEHLGSDSGRCAMHIKGLELPGYEPRAVKGYGLSMATCNMGGSHMYGRPRDELSGKTDPLTECGKGESIARVQKEQALEDSLIACTFGNSGLDLYNYSRLLFAASGFEDFEDVNNLLRIGERIVCLERCFNVREGFRRKDDSLPQRMVTEPLNHAGPANGQVFANLDGLLDEYYEAFGYSPQGVPTTARLESLDLHDVIVDLGGIL